MQSGTVLDRVKGYFSCLSRGEMPSMVANAEVLEQWRIELADDGQDTHTVRYLPPDGQKELRIYTRENGGSWQEADCGTMAAISPSPRAATASSLPPCGRSTSGASGSACSPCWLF